MERSLVYFASDVHLGLRDGNPAEREDLFIDFLKGIPRDALALYLLGDIWDFWYEYRDVVPRDSGRVTAALVALIDAGVQVWFIPGNHDIWTYSYLQSLGIQKVDQPYHVELGGVSFCLGHGDRLGGTGFWYGLALKMFHSKTLQWLFSTMHPWVAYRLARAWSSTGRQKHASYRFKGDESEPLYRFALGRDEKYCIFGHYHNGFDSVLPNGTRLVILDDWLRGGQPHAVFDAATSSFSLHS